MKKEALEIGAKGAADEAELSVARGNTDYLKKAFPGLPDPHPPAATGRGGEFTQPSTHRTSLFEGFCISFLPAIHSTFLAQPTTLGSMLMHKAIEMLSKSTE